jgi:O-antigen ligase
MILDNPMGLGVLQLEKIFPEPIHDIFLSSFVNYGWSGGITWLLMFGSSLVLAVENYRRTRSPIAVLLLFTFLTVVMCASLHEGEHWRHLWLFIGLLWGFTQANFLATAPAVRPAVSHVPAAAIPRAGRA